MTHGNQRGIQHRDRAKLLRTVDATNQGQAANSQQTEQQAMQHVYLSKGGRLISGSITTPPRRLQQRQFLTDAGASGSRAAAVDLCRVGFSPPARNKDVGGLKPSLRF